MTNARTFNLNGHDVCWMNGKLYVNAADAQNYDCAQFIDLQVSALVELFVIPDGAMGDLFAYCPQTGIIHLADDINACDCDGIDDWNHKYRPAALLCEVIVAGERIEAPEWVFDCFRLGYIDLVQPDNLQPPQMRLTDKAKAVLKKYGQDVDDPAIEPPNGGRWTMEVRS